MLAKEIQLNLLNNFCDTDPPFSGSIADWASQNVTLPNTYAMPGKVDLSISPWLLPPLDDVLDPKVTTIIKCFAIRIGKSMTDELTIPYWVSQAPSPILRVFQDDDTANNVTETKLIPVLKSVETIAPLISNTNFRKGMIHLPHMFIRISGDKETIGNTIGVRYLQMDEAHLYDAGLMTKFIGRTVDFAGRRKIIVSSTPNVAGSELHKYYLSGHIYEWGWCCPSCKQQQLYYWYKQRKMEVMQDSIGIQYSPKMV